MRAGFDRCREVFDLVNFVAWKQQLGQRQKVKLSVGRIFQHAIIEIKAVKVDGICHGMFSNNFVSHMFDKSSTVQLNNLI